MLNLKERLGIKIERRPASSLRIDLGVAVLTFIVALLAIAPILFMLGYNPLNIYATLFASSFGSVDGLAQTITKSIPLILIAAGVAIAFRSSTWNIGAPGQMIMGAIMATAIALFLPFDLPAATIVPLMLILGGLTGAGWAAICGILNEKFGINMVIGTLMFNFIALKIMEFLLYGPWQLTGIKYPYTDLFPTSAWIPTIPGTNLHYPTLIIGIASAILLFIILNRSKLGYEIKVFGKNRLAAKGAGISSFKMTMIVMMISGALAGLAGVGEVAGFGHQLKMGVDGGGAVYSTSYGYIALYIAYLGKTNPIGSTIASIFVAGLLIGGQGVQLMGLPGAIIAVILGLALLSLIAGGYLTTYKITRRRGKPQTKEAMK